MQDNTQTPKTRQIKPPAGTKPATGQHAAKKKRKLSGGALLSIVLVVLVLGVCAAVYLNIAGAKDALAGALGLTTIESASAQRAEAQAGIDEQAAEIASEKSALKDWEKALEAREKDLTERESAVGGLEDTVAQQEQAEAELQTAAQIFAQMDAESAAKAIAGTKSVDEMVKILTNMPSEKAALVMDEMDSSVASDILSEMMK